MFEKAEEHWAAARQLTKDPIRLLQIRVRSGREGFRGTKTEDENLRKGFP
jgi:hypothetical protein